MKCLSVDFLENLLFSIVISMRLSRSLFLYVRLVLPDEVVVSENSRDASSREAFEEVSSNAAGKEYTLIVEWLSFSCTTGLLPWTNLNGGAERKQNNMAITKTTKIKTVDIHSFLIAFLIIVGVNVTA